MANGLSSVTTVSMRFVLPACEWSGVQVITPALSMVALVGAARKEYVSVFAGRSSSVAVFVTTRAARGAMSRLVWPGRIGGVLTSWTITMKELVALSGGTPSSVT